MENMNQMNSSEEVRTEDDVWINKRYSQEVFDRLSTFLGKILNKSKDFSACVAFPAKIDCKFYSNCFSTLRPIRTSIPLEAMRINWSD